VIHSDVGSHNFLVQGDGTLALADFGGSVIDGASALVSYSTRYCRQTSATDDSNSTEVDDLFALGTVIYEIYVGHQMFSGQSSREIRKLMLQRTFPDLESIGNIPPGVKVVVRKCWAAEYCSANELLRDIKPSTALGLTRNT
jgi:serine/threonine protein kinase